jgi:hypothetical protein
LYLNFEIQSAFLKIKIMTEQIAHYKTSPAILKPLVSGILGITLLLPASFFLLTLLARIILGSKKLYHSIAPSFLQSPFDLWALHKAQFIVGSVVLAILLNGFAILQVQLQRGRKGWEVQLSFRRHWLNMAIALQGILLLLVLIAYTAIQHIRY